MSNLNGHIRSDKIKWIITGTVLLLVVIMLVGMGLQVFGQGKIKPSEWFKKEVKTEQTDDINNVENTDLDKLIKVDFENSPNILLVQGEVEAIAAADGSNVLSIPLTATVLPADATNKKVDWTMVNSKDEEVTSDVATMEVVGDDGSSEVRVKIFKFPASVLNVTVTTRDGGFQATAKINYYGSPRSFTIHTSSNYGVTVLKKNGSNVSSDGYQFEKSGDKYVIPGYASKDDEIVATYWMQLDYLGFFGEEPHKKDAAKDCTFTLKFSDGTDVPATHFTFDPMTDYSSKAILTFFFDETFWNTYRSKFINTSYCLVISVRNNVLKVDLGTIKIRFTVPVSSVSTSQSEILL